MKKRIVAIALLLCLVFLLGSCTTEGGYEYDGLYTYDVGDELEAEINELTDLFNTLFSGTTLELFEDGTWEIKKHIFFFLSFDIASGSYELSGGTYYLYGFDWDIDALGHTTEAGFDIDIYVESHRILTLSYLN